MEDVPAQRPTALSEEEFKRIVSGDSIAYLLPPRLRPVNPLREWHGLVMACYDKAVKVQVINEPFDGEEIVYREDIIATSRHQEEEQRQWL
jgi:hypothetical protein